MPVCGWPYIVLAWRSGALGCVGVAVGEGVWPSTQAVLVIHTCAWSGKRAAYIDVVRNNIANPS